MKLFLSSLFLFFFTATCSNATHTEHMEVTGTIEQQGMTSYQYGTHTLTNDETFYALKSEKVDLDEYVGKTVTVIADKISGYPLDGGPEYLMVLEIK